MVWLSLSRPCLIFGGVGLILMLIILGGCNPYSPRDDDLEVVPSGETTDSFSIRVTWWNEVTGVWPPIADATVFVEFVDTDNLDNGGEFVVRQTSNGITNPAGRWETTVTYHGTAQEAANNVHFRIAHPEFLPFNGVKALRNHQATTAVELAPDIN